MEVETLAGLRAAFEEWRSKKRHVREAVPRELLERARRATRVHGMGAVARATRLDGMRLKKGVLGVSKRPSRAGRVPAFSRVELERPAPARPFAEVETPTGVKVRLFTQGAEAVALLSSLCGVGGAR